MSGRRSHVRFVVSPPSTGVLRVLSDAEIEHIGHDEFSLISREPAAIDERILIDVPGDLADVTVPAQVAESRPIILGAAVRHALRLRVLEDGAGRANFARAARADRDHLRTHGSLQYADNGRLAVVIREFPVRLVNCSRSGCLFEAERPLEAGIVGTLSLAIEGHELTDHVLVVRCQAIAGAGPLHHIGARLLWVEVPGCRTIRQTQGLVENPV